MINADAVGGFDLCAVVDNDIALVNVAADRCAVAGNGIASVGLHRAVDGQRVSVAFRPYAVALAAANHKIAPKSDIRQRLDCAVFVVGRIFNRTVLNRHRDADRQNLRMRRAAAGKRMTAEVKDEVFRQTVNGGKRISEAGEILEKRELFCAGEDLLRRLAARLFGRSVGISDLKDRLGREIVVAVDIQNVSVRNGNRCRVERAAVLEQNMAARMAFAADKDRSVIHHGSAGAHTEPFGIRRNRQLYAVRNRKGRARGDIHEYAFRDREIGFQRVVRSDHDPLVAVKMCRRFCRGRIACNLFSVVALPHLDRTIYLPDAVSTVGIGHRLIPLGAVLFLHRAGECSAGNGNRLSRSAANGDGFRTRCAIYFAAGYVQRNHERFARIVADFADGGGVKALHLAARDIDRHISGIADVRIHQNGGAVIADTVRRGILVPDNVVVRGTLHKTAADVQRAGLDADAAVAAHRAADIDNAFLRKVHGELVRRYRSAAVNIDVRGVLIRAVALNAGHTVGGNFAVNIQRLDAAIGVSIHDNSGVSCTVHRDNGRVRINGNLSAGIDANQRRFFRRTLNCHVLEHDRAARRNCAAGIGGCHRSVHECKTAVRINGEYRVGISIDAGHGLAVQVKKDALAVHGNGRADRHILQQGNRAAVRYCRHGFRKGLILRFANGCLIHRFLNGICSVRLPG